jgi:predicted N-acetyltransferase YhbS
LEKNLKYVMREWQEGKDGVKLAQILSECFGPTTPRQVRRWIRQSGGKSFVLEVEGGEIVSSVGIEFKELHLGEGVYVKTAGIGGVCTCSDYRRKGIMTNLLQQSLNCTKNSGVSNSALYTGLTLPAHRIYQRLGFCDVQTWPFYVKFLDYPYAFRTWLRDLNRYLRCSKIARKTLQDWNRTIVFELDKIGAQSFRFRHEHFQNLPKPPKSPDITIATNIETLTHIMWGAMKLEDAIITGKMQVKHGSEADLSILRKVLTRIWDD